MKTYIAKFKIITTACFGLLVLSSCLKKDLPEYPKFDGSEITTVSIEHRFLTNKMINGQPTVAFQPLTVTKTSPDATTINLAVDIPAATGDFTGLERTKVSATNLILYFGISTAATMKGIDGTPNPGNPTDCTKPLKYLVTAANGTSKTWTVNVGALPAVPPVNQYEGTYTSNGYLYHPSTPRAITNTSKNLSTSGANGILVDLGDLGGSGYKALVTIQPNNTLVITAAPGAAGAPYTMFTSGLPMTDPGYTSQWAGSASCNNTYDPATKTFYLRYGYASGGVWRVTEEVIKKNP